MERYTLDAQMISLERFYEMTGSKKLVPGRLFLREEMTERFRILESMGIENLEQLLGSLGSKEKIGKVASASGIPENYLTLLKREAGSYFAKPFPLSDIPGVPFEYTEVLNSAGIRNTRDFFEQVQSSGQRRQVSAVTGIPENRIDEIFHLCDLSRISGVGALYCRILYDSGIRSVREFAETDIRTHNEKYLAAVEKYSYPAKPLSEDDIRYCLDYATTILEMNATPF